MSISDWNFLSVILKSIFALVSVGRTPCGPKCGNQSMVNIDKTGHLLQKHTIHFQTKSLISVLDASSVTPAGRCPMFLQPEADSAASLNCTMTLRNRGLKQQI